MVAHCLLRSLHKIMAIFARNLVRCIRKSSRFSRNINQWLIRNNIYVPVRNRKKILWLEKNFTTKLGTGIRMQISKWKNCFIKCDITRYIDLASGNIEALIAFMQGLYPIPRGSCVGKQAFGGEVVRLPRASFRSHRPTSVK